MRFIGYLTVPAILALGLIVAQPISAEVLFEDNFDATGQAGAGSEDPIPPDLAVWDSFQTNLVVHPDNAAGDYSLNMFNLNLSKGAYTIQTYPRGSDLTCTFKACTTSSILTIAAAIRSPMASMAPSGFGDG